MWKPLSRCAIVGGITVYVWLTVAWMILPMHTSLMKRVADEPAVVSCITRHAQEDGIYIIPSKEHYEKQSKDFNFIFINLRRGVNENMAKAMIGGFLIQVVGAGLITYLLLKTKVMKYWNRVWFVTMAGVIVAVLGIFPSWNWWSFPFNWVALEMFDMIVGWFLGGLVIAKLVKK